MEEVNFILKKFINEKKATFVVVPKNNLHSQLHFIVDEIRKDFGETAKKGKGSFSFYLGLLKNMPIPIIYKWLGLIKESKNLKKPEAKRKIFWWYYAQYRKNRKR